MPSSPSATRPRPRPSSGRSSRPAGTRRPGGSGAPGGPPRQRIAGHRGEAVLGPALEPLTYEHPIHMASRTRRLDDRRRRPPLPRCLQQRPVRRAQPPARRRGDRPPGPPPEHEPALSPRVGDRAGRAPGRDLPGRASTPSCSSTPAPRRTTSRGAWRRPGPATRAACARPAPTTASPRRAPPSPRRAGKARTRPGEHRDLGAAGHVPRDERRHRPASRPPSRGWRRAASPRPRRSSTAS